MDNVVQLFPAKKSEKNIFTSEVNSLLNNKMNLVQAEEMLNLITSITRKTKQEINIINSQAAFFKGQAIKTTELQNKVNAVLQKWSDKMTKLGLTPVSMFKVKFDLIEGEFHWEFPEMKLTPSI